MSESYLMCLFLSYLFFNGASSLQERASEESSESESFKSLLQARTQEFIEEVWCIYVCSKVIGRSSYTKYHDVLDVPPKFL